MRVISLHSYMRALPSFDSEVVSQAYYTEDVKVLETQGTWVQIQTLQDGYIGWIESSCIQDDSTRFFPNASVVALKALVFSEPSISKGYTYLLPFESQIQIIESLNPRWYKVRLVNGYEGFIQSGDLRHFESTQDKALLQEMLCDLAVKFLELPYVWGGRSSIEGYDCSGFIQMLLRQAGFCNIPRDSKDQYLWNKLIKIDDRDVPKKGDLIFFGKNTEKGPQITHVALSLGNLACIHATVQERPSIHISYLDTSPWNLTQPEIFNFRAIKRLKCYTTATR